MVHVLPECFSPLSPLFLPHLATPLLAAGLGFLPNVRSRSGGAGKEGPHPVGIAAPEKGRARGQSCHHIATISGDRSHTEKHLH